MAVMVGEIQCSNPECKQQVKFFQEGMQYANSTYRVTCPKCNQVTEFAGVGCVKYHGNLDGFVSAEEKE